METEDILKLAEDHGLKLTDDISYNEMGIDFKVGFASDFGGQQWVLRIPRRAELADQIESEKKILSLAREHLSIAVPDWKVASPTLIAYPLLKDKTVITFDAETHDVSWNIQKDSTKFVPSLARVLVELHRIPIEEVKALGLKTLSAEMSRSEILGYLETVKGELGIGEVLEKRWRAWLDNDRLWPEFTTFIHGDLYAGHILATKDGEVSGIIDWSEGQVSDPSIDFSGHITVFGEESLKELIIEYDKLGGKVWAGMFEQAVERQAASPLAYGIFALKTQSDEHIQAVKAQLRVG